MTGSRYDSFDVFSRLIVGSEVVPKDTSVTFFIWLCEIMGHVTVQFVLVGRLTFSGSKAFHSNPCRFLCVLYTRVCMHVYVPHVFLNVYVNFNSGWHT